MQYSRPKEKHENNRVNISPKANSHVVKGLGGKDEAFGEAPSFKHGKLEKMKKARKCGLNIEQGDKG